MTTTHLLCAEIMGNVKRQSATLAQKNCALEPNLLTTAI